MAAAMTSRPSATRSRRARWRQQPVGPARCARAEPAVWRGSLCRRRPDALALLARVPAHWPERVRGFHERREKQNRPRLVVAHVLHYPPPPTRTACNRYCSNKHTHKTLSLTGRPDQGQAGRCPRQSDRVTVTVTSERIEHHDRCLLTLVLFYFAHRMGFV